ncbi:MAG: fibronectin type III domain-containing protein, partial [Luteolibacter sp.]
MKKSSTRIILAACLLFALQTMFSLAAPTVATVAASNVTDLNATMKGTVNANGVGYWLCAFEYGIATSYGNELSPPVYWVDSSTSGTNTVTISGTTIEYPAIGTYRLAPATLYHYRIKVWSAFDSSNVYYGADRTFTTLAAATTPTIFSNSQNVNYSGATVTGYVFSGSSIATTTVEYGTSTSYGTQITIPGTQETNSTRAITAEISNLNPNTIYYYRWKAVNAQGTTTGSAISFTTGPKPDVTTTNATAITSNMSTVSGTINAMNGEPVRPYFEYGTTGSYGTISYNASPSFVSGG